MKRALLLLALTFAVMFGGAPTRAQTPLVFDLSSHLIAIRTDFAGAEVLLYGATEGEGDVIVVLRGPALETVVRRKQRIAGIWINTRQAHFRDAPVFYRVAASRPLAEIAAPALLARYQIGIDNLRISPPEDVSDEDIAAFRAGLLRNRETAGQYSREIGEVAFLGSRLFRTKIALPANVPAGSYTAEVFLLKGGQVTAAQTTPMFVSKSGVSAEVFDFAHRQAALYGLATIAFALFAGWAAGAVFRKA